MGTDNLGRDTLARVLAGGQISLAVGVAAMVLSPTLGTFVGVMAGFFRRLDGPLMRFNRPLPGPAGCCRCCWWASCFSGIRCAPPWDPRPASSS